LNAIKELNVRMDSIDEKFEAYNLRLNNLELKEIYERLENLERKERDRQAQALMQESYDKRFNILIHGLDENVESAWENRAQTKKIIQNFIKIT